MMDAGCYCLHVLRTLGGPVAWAAGVTALPEVVGATATMAPASTVRGIAFSRLASSSHAFTSQP